MDEIKPEEKAEIILWDRGKVINVEEGDFTFVDIKGKTISVSPDFILMIEEVKGGKQNAT
jgi:hypothetical protein